MFDQSTSQESPATLRCVTCADEALPALVVAVDAATGLAQVVLLEETTEVDISLVDALEPGDRVLVHGGVALARLDAE